MRSRPGRGQIFEAEAEAEAEILASMPLWSRGLNITGILRLNGLLACLYRHKCRNVGSSAFSVLTEKIINLSNFSVRTVPYLRSCGPICKIFLVAFFLSYQFVVCPEFERSLQHCVLTAS